MTRSAEALRRPDEQRLIDVASILAAGILRLRERQSLPVAKQVKNPGDSSPDRLEPSAETVLSVVHGGCRVRGAERRADLPEEFSYFARNGSTAGIQPALAHTNGDHSGMQSPNSEKPTKSS